jgi:hypothetical protein
MPYSPTFRYSPVLVLLAVAAACGGGDAARNQQMARGEASGVSGNDRAESATAVPMSGSAPRTAPRPASKTIAAGTRFVLVAGKTLCTNTSKVGDTFSATVSEPVAAEGFTVSKGTKVALELTRVERKTGVNNAVVMDVAATSMTIDGKRYALSRANVSPDITKIRAESKTADVEKVVGGAAIGAAAGALIGRNVKGTVIGAATGTAVGVGVAAAASNYEGCINANNQIILVTGSTVVVQ